MDIESFPLAWRWTQSSHRLIPEEVLQTLQPLESREAEVLANSSGFNELRSVIAFRTTIGELETRDWLKGLAVPIQMVRISWSRETALALPWNHFCEYWNDFCYPSSDDADVFLENGREFLRWNHYEVFEHDSNAL